MRLKSTGPGAVLLVTIIAATVALVLTGLVVVRPATHHDADQFTVNGSEIIDPGGLPFIPRGSNFNGPHFVWQGDSIVGKSRSVQDWGMNFVRLDVALDRGMDEFPQYNQALNGDYDEIIREYTSKRIVVMLAQFTVASGEYPTQGEVSEFEAFWVGMARKYASNPYVWFNLENEPGEDGWMTNPSSTWYDNHAKWSEAIRATGAMNMIVYDGAHHGQERAGGGDSQSAFLTWGRQLADRFAPVAFDLHVYDRWENAPQLEAFIKNVQGRGLPIFIGETGWTFKDTTSAVRSGALAAFQAAYDLRIGLSTWHAQGQDSYVLVEVGDFDAINSRTVPTNLSEMGQHDWSYLRFMAALPKGG